ncbi:cytochrome-c peroxidase [Reinekea blandensis]|uniref:Di-haem cytochrome c peroxidase family protein n=1 Tax=Reinekea blandensis MED297 TaxID=314283 RepID=A4BKK3_9GAMM|nr:cytochrome c peroxidase [Reinekea blandensis]EAR07356.1 di-haem cytochrome c peroxidase family protein [Reinekea sp. MED297] [Reinekea blandensis MED297]
MNRWIIALMLGGLLSVGAGAEPAATIELSPYCPPGFERVASNNCELRSLYQQYPSLQSQGVGGLKTGLPAYRDGFSPQVIDLGRYLFFDPVLSVNGTQSCATCHDPSRGMADGRAVSIGALGEEGTRSAPSLWNLAFQDIFFWDGRAATLEDQVVGPLYSEQEMANTPANLLQTLNGIPAYRDLFQVAFPQSAPDITLDEIYHALAGFEASLVSLNSRYDQYAHGYADALTPPEIEGLNVFRSFVARCAECHTPPLFTNQQIAVIGTPEPDGMSRDVGAMGVTGDASMRGGFKVPSLRNIELTAPYMHSGKYDSLWDATEFYTLGRGHAVPEGEHLYLHWHIWEPELTDTEIDRLVDFMKTLTDTRFAPRVPEVLPSGLSPISAEAFIPGN